MIVCLLTEPGCCMCSSSAYLCLRYICEVCTKVTVDVRNKKMEGKLDPGFQSEYQIFAHVVPASMPSESHISLNIACIFVRIKTSDTVDLCLKHLVRLCRSLQAQVHHQRCGGKPRLARALRAGIKCTRPTMLAENACGLPCWR